MAKKKATPVQPAPTPPPEKKPRRKRRTFDVSAEEFMLAYARAYRDGRTYEDLAEELDMDVPLLYSRRAAYRRQGYNLPSLVRSTKMADVDEMNERIQRIIAGDDNNKNGGMTRQSIPPRPSAETMSERIAREMAELDKKSVR